MNSGPIASRYATALFAFAKESKELEHVYEKAKVIQDIFMQLPKFRSALENPVTSKSDKKKLILSAAGNNVSGSLDLFIDTLLKNSRETFLQFILLKYIALYREEKNIHFGKLTTAEIMDIETEKKLISTMENKTGGTIELERVVDPTILGGFIFEIDHNQIDASVKGQLDSIRKEYIERNLKTI